MSLLGLPLELKQEIVDAYVDSPVKLTTVSKGMEEATQYTMQRLRDELKQRRDAFYTRCETSGRKNVIWNAFNLVRNLEECRFAHEIFMNRYDDEDGFIARVRYTIQHATQVVAEGWTRYVLTYHSRSSLQGLTSTTVNPLVIDETLETIAKKKTSSV